MKETGKFKQSKAAKNRVNNLFVSLITANRVAEGLNIRVLVDYIFRNVVGYLRAKVLSNDGNPILTTTN